MAYTNSSCALPTPAHPMAGPGYGKRPAPDQSPRHSGDFAHLPKREAAVAAFIDRLAEGAAMDHKTLAKHIADYGQAAIRSALKALTNAGHLRRIKEQVVPGRQSHHRNFCQGRGPERLADSTGPTPAVHSLKAANASGAIAASGRSRGPVVTSPAGWARSLRKTLVLTRLTLQITAATAIVAQA